MFSASFLINSYARNLHFIRTHTAGFSQADALRQPPFRGNCALWIVGHIALYRNTVLEQLQQAPTFDPALAQRFKAGSAAVLGEEPGLAQLSNMLTALDASQERIAAILPAFDATRAAELIRFGSLTDPLTRAETLLFLMRHEAYHTGQLELLAEMTRNG